MTTTTPEARLLVVEDEPNILELLPASLRPAGFEVATATGALEALQAVQRHRPDLIVLDVMLPDLDGNALTHIPPGSPVEVRSGPLAHPRPDRAGVRALRPADPAPSHADGGTGLGLSVVAALVTVHGGTVGVDGVPGRAPASAWSCPWPRRRRLSSQQRPNWPQGASPSIGGMKLRVVTQPAARPAHAGPMVEIVVPVHNEERVLEASIWRLHGYLTASFPFSFRITIADNACTDATWLLAERLGERLPEVRAVHLPEKGRGRALRQVWGASDAAVVA